MSENIISLKNKIRKKYNRFIKKQKQKIKKAKKKQTQAVEERFLLDEIFTSIRYLVKFEDYSNKNNIGDCYYKRNWTF